MNEVSQRRPTRRGVLSALGAGWALLSICGAAGAASVGRLLMRGATVQPCTPFKLGSPERYELGLSLRYAGHGIVVAKTGEGIYALSNACTFDSGCVCVRDGLAFHC